MGLSQMMIRVNGIDVLLSPEKEAEILLIQENNILPDKLSELEREANRRIELIAPTKDRDKLMSRTMHLMRRETLGTITLDEKTELDDYDAIQQQAESIRAAEASIKLEVEADPTIDILNHASWP